MNQDVLLLAKLARYEAALEKIAAPRRPDGTYNLERDACQQIAEHALTCPVHVEPVSTDEYAPADIGEFMEDWVRKQAQAMQDDGA